MSVPSEFEVHISATRTNYFRKGRATDEMAFSVQRTENPKQDMAVASLLKSASEILSAQHDQEPVLDE